MDFAVIIGIVGSLASISALFFIPELKEVAQGLIKSKPKIVISYSRDSHVSSVQKLSNKLKQSGYEIFPEDRNTEPSGKRREKIDGELRKCEYLLLVLTPDSLVSESMIWEIGIAVSLQQQNPEIKKPGILPICMGLTQESLRNNPWWYKTLQTIPAWEIESEISELFAYAILDVIEKNLPSFPLEERFSLKLPEASGAKQEEKTNPTHTVVNIVEEESSSAPSSQLLNNLEIPGDPVSLESPFYIERSIQKFNIEDLCYRTILQPSGLVRIKAPQQMGKTSLMFRILNRVQTEGYRTVHLRLGAIDRKIRDNLDSFLQWFCQEVGRKLLLEDKLSEYWDEELLSSISNCNDYFEKYLLSDNALPLVLGLDDVDRLFEAETAQDFFGMLRTWHEYGKEKTVWKKLHMAIAYSTDVYTSLNINRSPFNVGEAVELPEFDSKQVQRLVHLHELNWDDSQVNSLMEMVAGHPYLIRQALYKAVSMQRSLTDILSKAPTMTGIYKNHLQEQLVNLEESPDLKSAFQEVVSSDSPVQLPPIPTYKLKSMGLVKHQGDLVEPRCQLYRLYFRKVLG